MERGSLDKAGRIGGILRECEQLVRDAQAWNALHPGHEPLDVEPERVMASKCRAALAMAERGDADAFRACIRDLAEYGARVIAEE